MSTGVARSTGEVSVETGPEWLKTVARSTTTTMAAIATIDTTRTAEPRRQRLAGAPAGSFTTAAL